MIKFLVYQQGLWGAEFRTLGPMASIKPTVVENSQLFAQRTVRPLRDSKWGLKIGSGYATHAVWGTPKGGKK